MTKDKWRMEKGVLSEKYIFIKSYITHTEGVGSRDIELAK